MNRKIFVLLLFAAGAAALIPNGFARADEEIEKKKPIAAILDSSVGYDEYKFESSGNEILFAEIKSEVYQTMGRMCGSSEGSADSSEGCTDSTHTDETHDESCGGGGDDLCLQVLDPDGRKICWAGRPSRPGWQRDPRLACPLPEGFENRKFVLRVFRGKCGNVNMNDVSAPGEMPVVYLLFLQIMRVEH